MKQVTMLFLAMLMLAACDKGVEHAAMPGMQQDDPMQHMQVVISDGLLLAVYGVNMKLDGHADRGQELLSVAADMVRQAMSGPEMSMMHKGGHEHSPMMEQTHAWGDAAFDLIEQMMALAVDADDVKLVRQLNAMLAMTTSGRRMLLQHNDHGQLLLDQAAALMPTEAGAGNAYQTVARSMINMLSKSSAMHAM
ncbi:MAG: hypothetical protein R8K50_00895 [Mariprofundus sp.]